MPEEGKCGSRVLPPNKLEEAREDLALLIASQKLQYDQFTELIREKNSRREVANPAIGRQIEFKRI